MGPTRPFAMGFGGWRLARAPANPADVSRDAVDPSLVRHVERIEAYVRGSGLQRVSHEAAGLRRELAQFVLERTPGILPHWMREIGPAFALPEADWPSIIDDQMAATTRWARHIADPSDLETYVFLRRHTRHGFIGQFPASRFIASQMRLAQLLDAELRRLHVDDAERYARLATLLVQEIQVRVLHITDFFVEGREQLLLDQEASYRRAIDHAPACILRTDTVEGRVVDANTVAERMLRMPRAQLIGRRFTDLLPPPERAAGEALHHEAVASGGARRDDLHLLVADAELVPVHVSAGAIDYGSRHWVQLVCIDISEQRRLEAQLVQSEKMAAIGQLAAGIAHELRNPLAIVMNALYDLRARLEAPDGEITEDLRIAEDEIGRAQHIIKNLLEFSRESHAELERLDVNELVRRTLQLLDKYLESSSVDVTAELGDVPPCVANDNALRQILLNLVTNAVQAMPRGGRLVIRTAQSASDRLTLTVQDTGVGIPQAHLKDIFNPFFTTKAPGQGTGLGLFVVHAILQRYGGDIRVTSELGAGTTFTIELPCPCHGDVAPPA
jgi:PAS domain S-box-containing protein